MDIDEDTLERAQFAAQVGHIIRTSTRNDSFVIGLFGTWGSGKSTVLNFLERHLEGKDHILLVRFNPWYFSGTTVLLREFFRVTAHAIRRRQKKLHQTRITFLKLLYYFWRFSVRIIKASKVSICFWSLDLGAALGLRLGITLEKEKKRLNKVIADSKLRLVFLIDDLDRMESRDIRDVFRLIRLIADFPCSTFVLSMDRKRAVEALEAGHSKDGDEYLEKIVNLPLSLPRVPELTYHRFCLGLISRALKLAGDPVTDNSEKAKLDGLFLDHFAPLLRTPRSAKRYVRLLDARYSKLKSETNRWDFLLLTALQHAQPDLYECLPEHKSLLVSDPTSRIFDGKGRVERCKEEVAQVTQHIKGEATTTINILKELFPIIDFAEFGMRRSTGDAKAKKRICSHAYFDIYFTGDIPKDGFSDAVLNQIVKLSKGDPEATRKTIAQYVNSQNIGTFLFELRGEIESLPPHAANTLLLEIHKLEGVVPDAEPFDMLPTQALFRYGITELLQRIVDLEAQELAALKVLQALEKPQNLIGLMQLWWNKGDANKAKLSFLQEREKWEEGDKVVLAKIGRLWEDKLESLIEQNLAMGILWYWVDFGHDDIAKARAKEMINSHFDGQSGVYTLLQMAAKLSRELGGDYEIEYRFDENSYETINRLGLVETILARLKTDFGQELDDPKPHSFDLFLHQGKQYDRKRHLAHQFCYHHRLRQGHAQQHRNVD